MRARRRERRLGQPAVVVHPPRSPGLHLRARAARDGSRRVGRGPRRRSRRTSRVASALAAGRPLPTSVPPRWCARRGRHVSPRHAHRSCGSVPRRASAVPSTRFVCGGGHARRPPAHRCASAWRRRCAGSSRRPWHPASSAARSQGRSGGCRGLHPSNASGQQRGASRGLAPPPGGVPCSRATRGPAGLGTGACRPRARDHTPQGRSVGCFTARLRSAGARVSPTPGRSSARPQAARPPRARLTAGRQRRLPRPVPRGLGVKHRLHRRLHVPLAPRLGPPIRHRRPAERPRAARALRARDPPPRGRDVPPRGPPRPARVEVVRELPRTRRARLALDTRRPLGGRDRRGRLPDLTRGHPARCGVRPQGPPRAGWPLAHASPWHPLAPAP
jgi:hypothetical protein